MIRPTALSEGQGVVIYRQAQACVVRQPRRRPS